jgi:molybdenum cofactor biosynthesis enzyme MoaA
MKIQTFSIVAGTRACNARCPFCISRMTPEAGLGRTPGPVNWRNFRKGALFAARAGVTTAMITGKGEPTLFPERITEYLEALDEFQFPFLELQTNGIALDESRETYAVHLKDWYHLGLSTIALSIVHYEAEKNRRVYLPHRERYIDLPDLIGRLHDQGFSVRLSAVLVGGFIDSPNELGRLIDFARETRVEQLTVRPVNQPQRSQDPEAHAWAVEHRLEKDRLAAIADHLNRIGRPLMKLIHGAVVYDVDGQNVCLTDSLTLEAEGENLRQLIFFPDGHLRYDWQYEGAVIL